MDVLDVYALDGFLDFVQGLSAAVPIGFSLGLFLGLLSFGAFKLLGLFRNLVSR